MPLAGAVRDHRPLGSVYFGSHQHSGSGSEVENRPGENKGEAAALNIHPP